jgi:general secretion pathway protein I
MIFKKRLKGSSLGFTFLEVMIALAILSIVAVAFLRNQAINIRLGSESIHISLATLLAREKMAELESLGFPEPGEKSGIMRERIPPLRWEQIVSATEFLNLRKGQVRVFWNEGVQERVLELTAYFSRK